MNQEANRFLPRSGSRYVAQPLEQIKLIPTGGGAMIIEHCQKNYTENIIIVQYTGDYDEKILKEALQKNYPNTKNKIKSINKPTEFYGMFNYGEVIYQCEN
jgi:hypothetical protein